MSTTTRTVSLELHPEYLPPQFEVFHAAIGYMATWSVGIDLYRLCTVYGDQDGTLQAVYQEKSDGQVNHTIMACLGEDGTYGFHHG